MERERPRDSDQPPAGADRLRAIPPMHVDYDEDRSAQERRTYHQPRLVAQGEFFLDVHPVKRLKSLRARTKRKA